MPVHQDGNGASPLFPRLVKLQHQGVCGSRVVLDDWILTAIEASGLQFGGGGTSDNWEGLVESEGRGSATDERRRIVDDWLSREPRVLDHEVGPLTDAWRGDVDLGFDDRWPAEGLVDASTGATRA